MVSNDRARRRARGAVLAVLASGAFVSGCSSRADAGAAGTLTQPLVDGGTSPRGNEYTVFLAPQPAPAPTPRVHPAVTFDGASGVTVLVGGNGLSPAAFGETWTYDGAWKKQCDPSCATQPVGRYLSSLVYVPERRVSVLFAGVSAFGEFICDTWEWETATSTWTARANPTCDGGLAAPRGAHAAAAFADKAVVFGGFVDVDIPTPRSNDLLAWNGTEWSRLCDGECVTRSAAVPAPRAYATLSYAPLARGDTLLLFGGEVGASGPAAAANDLWAFDVKERRWSELCATSPCKDRVPPPRAQHGAVYDPVRGRLVVHAGCNGPCNAFLSDAWEYDPEANRWAPLPEAAPHDPPSARARFGTAFDSRRRRVVEFGGEVGSAFSAATVEFYTRGGECSSSAGCHTGVCQTRVCVEPCSESGPSGACIDGYACNGPCALTCQTCASVPGVCTAITSGPDPAGAPCNGGSVCVAGPTGAAGVCKLAAGQPCSIGAECATGICSAVAPNVCVDVTCNQPCQYPQGGACVPRGRGAEPPDQGCRGLRCGDEGLCLARCGDDRDCVPDHFCEGGQCRPHKESGDACARGAECRLGHCVDGVCCETACGGPCDQCGKDGKCLQRTGKVDPAPGHSQCGGTAECRGYCDGRSACIYPGDSVKCGEPSCAGRDYSLAANACNGDGQCVARAAASCNQFACNEATGECYTECNRNSDCRRGAVCRIGADGRGACNDEGSVCASDWEVRGPTGNIEGCEGRPCRSGQCLPPECAAGVPGECAPGFECRGQRCVDMGGGPGGPDAGRRRFPPDGEAPRDAAPGDAGDAPAESGGGSCGVARSRSGGTGTLGALLLAALTVTRRVRRRGGERVRIVS